MKTTTFLIIFILFSLAATAQFQSHDWNSFNLKGKVRSMIWSNILSADSSPVHHDSLVKISHTAYHFNNKGGLVEENYFVSGSNLSSAYFYKYDDRGNMVEEPDIMGGTYIFKYDEKGRVIEAPNKGGEGAYYYKYDEKGRLFELTMRFSRPKTIGKSVEIENRIIFSYDENGRSYLQKHFQNAGGIGGNRDVESMRKTFEFDAKGNIIEEDWENPRGKLIWKIINRYNANGILTEIGEYRPNGKLAARTLYDDQGNLTEKSEYNPNGNLIGKSQRNYRYEYDGRSNWIRRYDSMNGMVQRTQKRVIIYY